MTMQIDATPFADINELLELILSRTQGILGKKLIGLYIFGSLVVGDFDYESSDIDLVAAITAELDENEFERLKMMHTDITLNNKTWDDRIEIGYISVENLKKSQPHFTIALISPGEPFHVKEADTDWIINRYVLREKGITLFGPAPQTLVEPIAREELIQAVQEQAKEWREWIHHERSRNFQAFAILTMCRALYTVKTGEFVSKKQAALWAEKELPQWSSFIQHALLWREAWRDEQVEHDVTLPETLRFVRFAINLCLNEAAVSKTDTQI